LCLGEGSKELATGVVKGCYFYYGHEFLLFFLQNYYSVASRQILCSIIFVKNNIFKLSSRCNIHIAVSVPCM
jgi:hypothetical protein